ncbi:unnamed protein product [Gordionus sp. m RMFG-2023]
MLQNNNEEINAIMDQRFNESEEKLRLKEELNLKLIECGWKEEVKELCKKSASKFAEEKGIENVTADDLINDITPQARGLVPDHIKVELLNQVKEYLEKQPEFSRTET